MKKTAIVIAVLLLVTIGCTKNRKHCWKCHFNRAENMPTLDTTVCDMTEDESKDFQQQTAKRMKDEYGNIGTPSSTCWRTNR